jgi:addiction module HigA family antidote
MTETQGIRLKRPAHPGGFIRHEVFGPHGLSVTEAAKALGVTRPALSALLKERVGLSPEMAIRVEKAFGVSQDTLMDMQRSFDARQEKKGASDH